MTDDEKQAIRLDILNKSLVGLRHMEALRQMKVAGTLTEEGQYFYALCATFGSMLSKLSKVVFEGDE